MSSSSARYRVLAIAVLAAMALFLAGCVAAAMLQGAGYDWTRHDISDLAAMSARAPWVMLSGQALAGGATIAFALGALGPALALPGRGTTLGAWLVAGSLMGLDNVSDVFFRLDCMAGDPGCTQSVATASPAGTIHLVAGGLTALLTVAAPFVLLPRLRRLRAWSDLTGPSFAAGVALFVLLAAYLGLEGRFGQGIVQRLMAVVLALWIGSLAWRVHELAGVA